MLKLARRVGQVFGLDLYGVDILETPQGLVLVDINDFPSFYGVPRKVQSIAEYILHAAYRARRNGDKHAKHATLPAGQPNALRRQDTKLVPAELMRNDPKTKLMQTH